VLPAVVLTAAARELGMSFLGTRSTRLGLPQGAEAAEGFGRGGWVRVIGRTGESTADTSLGDLDFDAQTAGIEAGIDLYRTSADDGSGDQAGVYAGYASGWGDVGGLDGGSRSGSYTLRGTSLGAYWTHVGAGGWYVDAVVQGTWYSARTSSPEDIGASTDGFGWLTSLEGGYPIALDEHQSIVPQLQLVYGETRFDDADDGYATFEFDDGTSLLGRAGLRWQRTDDIDLGEGVTLVTPYIEASLWHAFEGDGTVAIGGEDVDVSISETWATIGLGGTAQLAPGAALFGDVAYEVSVDGVERQSVSGRAGLKLTW
jgi:outer membrane autotransporter protein